MCGMFFCQKSLWKRLAVATLGVLSTAGASHGQRSVSLGAAVGAAFQRDVVTTAAFNASAMATWQIPWFVVAQRSVSDLRDASGTVRNVSVAVLPAWEPFGIRLLLAAGPSVHDVRRDVIGPNDEQTIRFALTGIAALRLPLAGDAVSLEMLGRADILRPNPLYTALLGARFRPGAGSTLLRGERAQVRTGARDAAVWNDVVMQLILLQQNLESFTRIKEIDTGIELEFDQRSVTLYDDVAKAARVLAAADPPVIITVFAPNAGRTGAAVTAGSFPAERLRMQRDSRVYLRVEH